MFGLLRILGMMLGAISLTILLWRGGSIEFGNVVSGVLEVYESQLQQLFHLVQPATDAVMESLRAVLGSDLQLHPHWKHVFILLWLIQGSAVVANWRLKAMIVEGEDIDLHGLPIIDAVVGMTLGLVLTFVTAVAAGTVPIASANLSANLMFGAIVLIGMQVTSAVVYFASFAIGFVVGYSSARLSRGSNNEAAQDIDDLPDVSQRSTSVLANLAIATLLLFCFYSLIVYDLPNRLPAQYAASVAIYALIGVVLVMTAYIFLVGLVDARALVTAERSYATALWMDSYVMRAADIMLTLATATGLVLIGTAMR